MELGVDTLRYYAYSPIHVMALTPSQRRELLRYEVGESGNRIVKARALAGLTQAELAERTGLTQPYVSDVDRGRYGTITLDNARKFAECFGCSIEDLFPAPEKVEV